MSGPLTMLITAQPKNDQAEALFQDDIANAQASEPGSLTFRMFRQEDGTLRYYNDFASSEALLDHLDKASQRGATERFVEAHEITSVLVLGDPTPAAKEFLDQFGSTYGTHVNGFSRLGMVEATA